MDTLTLKEYVASEGITQIIPKVRTNKNGYPFVTFVDSKNEAENIYFSKRLSAKLTKGQSLDNEFIRTLRIAVAKNEAGEERVKLTHSERLELADVLN